MARLIDDMLSLARLARTTVVPRPVDLSKLANELVSELCAASPERRVEFRVHDGMHVDGDELLLRTALCHLLQNAWRYTPETLGARIEIGRERRDGQVVHFVRDNGEGFEMKYAAMIFGDFQRLDPTHQLGSTGVGLAITQRIIKRHGGQIWAEASPGAGATFYFTLRGDD